MFSLRSFCSPAVLGSTCAALFAGYLVFTIEFCSPYAGTADSSGYLNSARFLLEHKVSERVPVIPGIDAREWDLRVQEPLGFLVRPGKGVMVPGYPVGYPMHLALAAMVVGLDRAAILANVCLTIAAAALMAALGRQFGLAWAWCAAGIALLLSNPLFMMFAQRPMSDAPAMVWAMAAVWLALRAQETWAWGIASGVAVGVAVLVRPTDILVMLPVAVALGLRWRSWLALAGGGLPCALFLVRYNLVHYGWPFAGGFGNPSILFGARCALPNTGHFLGWAIVLLSPPVMLLAACLPASRQQSSPARVLLSAWVGIFVLFYLFYREAGGPWWSLRFILPVFPPLILSALLVAHSWMKNGQKGGRWKRLLPLLLCVAVAWQIVAARNLSAVAYRRERVFPDAAKWMNAHVPANAIVLQFATSGASAYYSHFTLVRWDLISPAQARRLYEAAQRAHLPVYACLLDSEPDVAFKDHLSGNWERLASVEQASFWRLVPTQPKGSAID
jgi:hypothetical protein